MKVYISKRTELKLEELGSSLFDDIVVDSKDFLIYLAVCNYLNLLNSLRVELSKEDD